MTNDELFKGIRVVGQALEAQSNPLAKALGVGLGITMDAVDIAEKDPSIDPVALLRTFREGLRAGVTAELQAALDASSSNG